LALVARTLQYQGDLERAVAAIKGASQKLQAAVPNRAMRLLLLYDLLLGSGKIDGGGKASRAVKELKDPLSKFLAPVKAAAEAQAAREAALNVAGEQPLTPLRYVRVNTIKVSSLDEAEEELRQHLMTSHAAHVKAVEQQEKRLRDRGGAAMVAAPEGSVPDNSNGHINADAGASDDEDSFEEESDASKSSAVWRDAHVANLLVCRPPPGTRFHDHPRVMSGCWILQDKASCFSAEALCGPDASYQGGDVLDACAAPGNKTTHCASLLAEPCNIERAVTNGKRSAVSTKDARKVDRAGVVYALDRDPERLKTLQLRAAQAGCCAPPSSSTKVEASAPHGKKAKKMSKAASTNARSSESDARVAATCSDFLAVDPSDAQWANLRAVLLDPSCSGSGIGANSLDRLVDAGGRQIGDQTGGERFSAEKIAGLVKFQKAALRKAFSFPQVNRVVYSTCSIHDAENELVVAAVLRDPFGANGDDIDDDTSATSGTTDAISEGGSSGNNLNGNSGASAPRPGPFVLRAGLPHWPRRGRAVGDLSEDEAACLVRADPSVDDTHGFFVACFERLDCDNKVDAATRGKGSNTASKIKSPSSVAASAEAAAAGARSVAAAAKVSKQAPTMSSSVESITCISTLDNKRKRTIDEDDAKHKTRDVPASNSDKSSSSAMSMAHKAGAKKAEKRRLKRQRLREGKRENAVAAAP